MHTHAHEKTNQWGSQWWEQKQVLVFLTAPLGSSISCKAHSLDTDVATMIFLLSRWGNQNWNEEIRCLTFSCGCLEYRLRYSSSWGKHFTEWAIFPALGISSINARSCVFKKHTVDDMPKCSTSHSTAAIKHADQALLKGGVILFGLHFQVIVHQEGKLWRELQAGMFVILHSFASNQGLTHN